MKRRIAALAAGAAIGLGTIGLGTAQADQGICGYQGHAQDPACVLAPKPAQPIVTGPLGDYEGVPVTGPALPVVQPPAPRPLDYEARLKAEFCEVKPELC